jgi:hypothetical protein
VPYSGRVTITPPGGEALACSVDVGDDAVAIVPDGGAPVVLPFIDIEDVHDDDYTLRLTDYTGARYDLTMFGKPYGQILAEVRKRRNDALQRDLLLTGVNLTDTYPAKWFGGPEPVPVEVRLFEDLMVVVPERGTMWGLPYSFIQDVRFDAGLYQTHVTADDGSFAVFGQMGLRSEEFPNELQRLLDALAARTARTLAGLLPRVPPGSISRLAAEMRDGRAVQQRAVDAIDLALWPRLEKAIVGTEDLRKSYDRLKSIAPPEWTALGVKASLAEKQQESGGAGGYEHGYQPAPSSATERQGQLQQGREAETERRAGGMPGSGAMLGQLQQMMAGVAGDAAGKAAREALAGVPNSPSSEEAQQGVGPERPANTLWFFAPLSRDGRPVNLVAQEVTSDAGHATYLYRLMDADRFASLSGDALAEEVAAGIRRLNQALLTLNFRREPIYLPEDQIASARFAKYAVALRKLDYLQWARRAFVTRLIHNQTWEQQLADALERA